MPRGGTIWPLHVCILCRQGNSEGLRRTQYLGLAGSLKSEASNIMLIIHNINHLNRSLLCWGNHPASLEVAIWPLEVSPLRWP